MCITESQHALSLQSGCSCLAYFQNEEARMQRELEVQEKRIRKELVKQEILRQKVLVRVVLYLFFSSLIIIFMLLLMLFSIHKERGTDKKRDGEA